MATLVSVPVGVEVCRGGRVESRHRVALVVVDAAGRQCLVTGDSAMLVFPRSAFKPIQALPLVETGAADAFGLSAVELALACASHGGEPGHVAAVEAWLARLGLKPEHLACGAHLPNHAPSAAALLRGGGVATRVHNNCSGKHSGMLTTALHLGEPLLGYERPDHPVQRRVQAALEALAGERLRTPPGVDGCGLPAWTLSLAGLARTAARFAEPSVLMPERRSAADRLKAAMRAESWHVAGTGRACTAIMQTVPDLVVKTGAEGVYWGALPGQGCGLAIKVEDGAGRAAEPALLATLAALGVIDAAASASLAAFANPTLRNAAGEVVGEIRVVTGWPERS